MQGYTQLYRAIHSNTGQYTPIQGYTQLYRALHSYTGLYTAIHGYTGLNTVIHCHTGLYKAIHSHTQLYRAIHSYTELYIQFATICYSLSLKHMECARRLWSLYSLICLTDSNVLDAMGSTRTGRPCAAGFRGVAC